MINCPKSRNNFDHVHLDISGEFHYHQYIVHIHFQSGLNIFHFLDTYLLSNFTPIYLAFFSILDDLTVHLWGFSKANILVISPMPLVRPSRNSNLDPTLIYSGRLMNRKMTVAFSLVWIQLYKIWKTCH